MIVICIRGRITFGETLKLARVKKSTLWDCVRRLNDLGMVKTERIITVLGPRVMLICEEGGRKALKELEEMLEGGDLEF